MCDGFRQARGMGVRLGKFRSMEVRRGSGLPGLVMAGLALSWLGGCQVSSHPFRDELAGILPVTTASVEGLIAADVAPAKRSRGYAPVTSRQVPFRVTHGPLLLEDPAEQPDREDAAFCWTGEDVLQAFQGGARFLLNAALAPVSALWDTPLHKPMASDGIPSRRIPGGWADADFWCGCPDAARQFGL